tara:strand:- start:255 stop:566 length:312 start_codon:yes stop_codon:yes gene_type:complete
MKKFKFVFFLVVINFLLYSCSTIKEGFTSQKKNSIDEFLVEKKSPLIMPPEFNKLPEPITAENEVKESDNNLENLLKDSSSNNSETTSQNKNLEESIINRIKK